MTYRFDFLFSYWIFIWFIGFQLKLTKQNPFFALTVAVIVGLVDLWLIWSRKDWIYFLVVFFIVKGCPFLYLIHTRRVAWDIRFTFMLGFLYIVYLKLNNVTNLTNLYYGKTKVAPLVALLKSNF